MKKLLAAFLVATVLSTSVNAYSYVLIEGKTGQIISESDADEVVNIGALTKLMTALITAEKLESGELNKKKLITVNSAVTGTKGAVVWLTAGEKMKAEELLKGMLTGNANDCSVALACEIGKTPEGFVEMMNKRADELSMLSTEYIDCISACTSTAKDIAVLSNEVIKHEMLKPYMSTWMDYMRNGETMLVNNNQLIRSFNGTEGLLSGATEQSSYCISASALRDDKRYLVTVLGGEDEDTATVLAKELLNLGFSSYSLYSPQIDESQLQPIEVDRGVDRSVNVRIDGISEIVIANGTQKDISYELQLEEKLTAPVEENQTVGTLVFKKGDEVICENRIVTVSKVEKMTSVKYFWEFIKSFFALKF